MLKKENEHVRKYVYLSHSRDIRHDSGCLCLDGDRLGNPGNCRRCVRAAGCAPPGQAQEGNMRKWRKVIAWVLLLVLLAAGDIMSVAAYISERGHLVNIEDALGARLPQMVQGNAVVQPAAGAGATASVNGNDAVGQVNITTGANPGSGSLIHVTFVTPYRVQPFVYVTPEDAPPPADWYVTIDWNGWDIWVATPPKPDTNYPFNYFVAARPWSMYLGANGRPVDENGKPAQY
jgi:hypothetical protein